MSLLTIVNTGDADSRWITLPAIFPPRILSVACPGTLPPFDTDIPVHEATCPTAYFNLTSPIAKAAGEVFLTSWVAWDIENAV